MQFEWDPAKARANLRRHGVSFEEAASAFADPVARIHDDPEHSAGELREIVIGQSGSGRLVLVSFTERESGLRIISARLATLRERRNHEQAVR